MKSDTAMLIRSYVIDILKFFNLDWETINKIDKVVKLEYFPVLLITIGLIVLLFCLCILYFRNKKKKQKQKLDEEERELRKNEELKKVEEDKRLALYQEVIRNMAEELGISEARLDLELENIFSKSDNLKDAEVYHRVTITRTPRERDIIISNWYMNEEKINVIKSLIRDELNKAEVQNIKNEKYIKQAMSEKDDNSGTWECIQCGNINNSSETKCLKCGCDR